jgi:hypothetical protein
MFVGRLGPSARPLSSYEARSMRCGPPLAVCAVLDLYLADGDVTPVLRRSTPAEPPPLCTQ